MSLALLAPGPVVADQSAPPWTTPRVLGPAVLADTPVAVSDGVGDDTVAWTRPGPGSTSQVVVARHRAGGAWSAPYLLDSSSSQTHVAIATTPAGSVTVAWSVDRRDEEGDGTTQVRTATYAEGAWTPAQTRWEGGYRVQAVDLAVNASGGAALAFATYRQPADTGARVLAEVRDPGGSWSPAHRLDSGRWTWVEDVRIGIDAAGNAAVVWRTGSQTRTNRWDGDSWSADRRLIGQAPAILDFALKPDGTAAVVYGAGSTMIKARLADATGDWGEQVVVAGAPDSIPVFYSVAVAAGPGDRWGVAWGGGRRIRLREYAAGAWQPLRFSRASGGLVKELRLLYRSDGDALLVWNANQPTGRRTSQIQSVTRAGRTWSPVVPVSGAGAWLTSLVAAGDGQGHAVVVWHRPGRRDHVSSEGTVPAG